MSSMGTKLRRTTNGIVHWCPACKDTHSFALDNPQHNGAKWVWDGNVEAPTVSPSMRIRWGSQADPKWPARGGVCHYTLTMGMINYCGDCTHELKGHSVPLPPWPYAPGAYGGLVEEE